MRISLAETQQIIERNIKAIAKDFRATKGLILTETDLQCLIYSKLKTSFSFRKFSQNQTAKKKNTVLFETNSAHAEESWRLETCDTGIFASPVHTELAWYDDKGKLAIKPDITILDPKNLSILHGFSTSQLPSKQYAFGGKAILLELKFIRDKDGLDIRKLENSIKKDFNKITRLHNNLRLKYHRDQIFCYFVIFNKTNNVCNEFNEFMDQYSYGDWYKFLYSSGNVHFPT
jgi:hypothetical protein